MPSKPFCRSASEGMQSVILPSWNSGFEQTKSTRKLTFLGAVSWWARVDYASRASKKAPQGLFSPPDCSAGRCCSNPPTFVSLTHKQNKKLQRAKYARAFLVGAGGFEPPKLKAADLQSVPIGHSGTRPYSFVAHPYAGRLVYFSMRREICQLSFLLFFSEFKQHPTKAGKDAMTGAFYGNRALLWCNCRKEKAKII